MPQLVVVCISLTLYGFSVESVLNGRDNRWAASHRANQKLTRIPFPCQFYFLKEDPLARDLKIAQG